MFVVFGSARAPISLTIRTLTWSRWSHCGILGLNEEGEPTVFESVEFKGVITTPLDEFMARYDRFEIGHIDAMVDWEFVYSQLGFKYDYLALLGYLFKQDWHDPLAWFCSEFTAKAARRISDGKPFFKCNRVQRISPESVWRVTLTVGLQECLSQLESDLRGEKYKKFIAV